MIAEHPNPGFMCSDHRVSLSEGSEDPQSSDYQTAAEDHPTGDSSSGEDITPITERKSKRERKPIKRLKYYGKFVPNIKRYGSLGMYCISNSPQTNQ